MEGWVKHFRDSTSIVGSDNLVMTHRVSWSRGRLDDMVAVDLHVRGKVYTLSFGLGSYWQSDTMKVGYSGTGKKTRGKVCVRRIGYLLTQADVGKRVIWREVAGSIVVGFEYPKDEQDLANLIQQEKVGQWIVLSVDLEHGYKVTLSHSEKRP